jgi:hypothetical protein
MTTYFGECQSDGSLIGAVAGYDYGGAAFVANVGIQYTAPGSGVQNIESLGIYSRSGGTSGDIRCALYNDDLSLRCQWNAALTIADDTPSWRDYAVANLTGTTTVVGGLNYHFYFTVGASNYPQQAYNTGNAGDWKWGVENYLVTGFPANVAEPAGGNSAGRIIMRCGIASSVFIEQEGFRFRNDDGSESAATWGAAQDTNITLASNTATRIRILLNATGDPASIGAQLEYRYKPSGGAFGAWTKVN